MKGAFFHENQKISFPAAVGGYGVQLLTATAFAAAPAEEENGFFDFLLGKKYTYFYAALTWDEYWANEKVYAAGSTAASAQLDSHEEQDLGAFDAVSRATVNHGLHRGSFQSTAVIYAKDGSSYTVSHWSDDGKTIYLPMAPPLAGTAAPLPRLTAPPCRWTTTRCWAPSMCLCA